MIDPYNMSKEDLAIFEPEILFVLDKFQQSLRVKLKRNSKAKKLLEGVRGVSFINYEKLYFFPTEQLNSFIRQLKAKQVSFGVETSASIALKASANVRASILSNQIIPTAKDLRLSKLAPIIDSYEVKGETWFRFSNYTVSQITEAFPALPNFNERKETAKRFSFADFFRIFKECNKYSYKIWFTAKTLTTANDPTIEIISQEKPTVAIPEEVLRERERLLDKQRQFLQMKDAECNSAALSNPKIGELLFPHQRVAIKWLCETKRAFLGDDMGLGKTLTVITYYEFMRVAQENDFLLIVCPNSLTRNWGREMKQWFPKKQLLVFPEGKKEKIDLLKRLQWGAAKVDGIVLNYESVRLEYVLEGLKKLLSSKRPLLCLDESQRVKNHASKTFEAMLQLIPFCERRVLLSGTPTPKDITDIWAQIRLLDDGERFGKSYYRWLAEVAVLGTKFSQYAVKSFKPDAVKETTTRVQELLLRRKKENVVNLPEKTFITRDVELKGNQLKRYEALRKELLVKVTSTSGGAFEREVSSILEEYLRAVQLASNPRLVDETWEGEPAKFEELDSILEDVIGERDEKVVIWTNYLGNIRELTHRYKKYGAQPFSGETSVNDRAKIIEDFQNSDQCKVLVAIPAAGGVGITLTASQTAIYLDKTWNAEHWMQSIDRIHRIGQTGTVRIISLHSCRIDELISWNLRRKEKAQASLLGDYRGDTPEWLSADNQLETNEQPSKKQLLEAVRG